MTASSLAATVGRPLPWLLAAALLSLSSTTTKFFIDAFLSPCSLLESRSVHQYVPPSPTSTTPSSTQTPPSFNLARIASITPTKSALKYAPRNNNESNRSGGPMSQVDSTKSGGCPFLDTSYVYKTYAVPALFSESDSRPIVLFDGECNLCNNFVQTLLKYDSCDDDIRGNLRFAAMQSHVGDLLLRRMSDDLRAQVLAQSSDTDYLEKGEKYKTIVVCAPDKTYIKSSAVFQILQSLGGSSKRLKVIQYLALLGYILPTRVRDGLYQVMSKRRKKWFGTSDECLLWDARFETRFVDDGVLTGTYRDPFANQYEKPVVPASINLFEGDIPPVRGDGVRIIWPEDSKAGPSISYDDEFPDGICMTGGTATISTIDLPMRIVLRVDRKSLGLGPDEKGGETMIAWVKPQEVAVLQ